MLGEHIHNISHKNTIYIELIEYYITEHPVTANNAFPPLAAIIVEDKVFAGGGFTGSRSVWFGEAQCVLHSGYGRRAGLVLR